MQVEIENAFSQVEEEMVENFIKEEILNNTVTYIQTKATRR